MVIANLGAGTKTSTDPSVVNVDWSIYHRVNQNPFMRKVAPLFFRGERATRLNRLGDNVVVHNLAKGIPFPDGSVHAVYHSHLLEHLDREVAPTFMAEIYRVLKPGGIHRVAVPDLEKLCRSYLESLDSIGDLADDSVAAACHEDAVEAMILQMVRREAYGTSLQGPARRRVENLILGDARKRGETHQWMYDRVTLPALLRATGFKEPVVMRYNDSAIPNWQRIGLELNEDGSQYKPESLYVESVK